MRTQRKLVLLALAASSALIAFTLLVHSTFHALVPGVSGSVLRRRLTEDATTLNPIRAVTASDRYRRFVLVHPVDPFRRSPSSHAGVGHEMVRVAGWPDISIRNERAGDIRGRDA